MAAETIATDAPTYAELLARIEALEAGQQRRSRRRTS